jgi:prophage regulatory protein
MTQIKIIRKPEVISISGLSKSTLQNRINDQLMPSPISLGGRAVGFLLHEINQVLAAMISGMSPEQIKALVIKQSDQRSSLLEEFLNA